MGQKSIEVFFWVFAVLVIFGIAYFLRLSNPNDPESGSRIIYEVNLFKKGIRFPLKGYSVLLLYKGKLPHGNAIHLLFVFLVLSYFESLLVFCFRFIAGVYYTEKEIRVEMGSHCNCSGVSGLLVPINTIEY